MTDAEPIQKVPGQTPMTACQRVQKFRQSLKDGQRWRFEACVDVTVVDEVTAVTEVLEIPVWRAVENALAAYCDEFDALVAEQQRLDNERSRIERYGRSSDTELFNRDLRSHSDRVSRFLRHRVGQTG